MRFLPSRRTCASVRFVTVRPVYVSAAPYGGYVDLMTAVTFDVPELVASVASDQDGRSALEAALTEAAIDHIRRNHPDQLADVVSRIVVEIDRDLIDQFHAA